MYQRLKNEPVVIAALTSIAALLGAKFGLRVTPDQLFNASVALVSLAAWWARSQVTPVAKLRGEMPPSLPAVDMGDDLEQTPTGKP